MVSRQLIISNDQANICFQTKQAIELKIKLLTDIKLAPLMPDENNNFGSSLVLDFIKMMCHLQPNNI